ncbi:transglycosylase family protein [Streptomyces sp. NPDC004726]
MTGSAIAIPLLGAGSASAADAAVWDRIAECESAGLWSANTGNGYYGGLQFSASTWAEFGGTEYAARPDLASRSQQIAVAEKVLAAQGPQAWSACASLAGLTKDNPGDGVDPGVSGEPSAAPTKTPSGTPSGTPAAGQKTSSPSKTGTETPKTPAEATQGVGNGDSAPGRHRGEPAPDATGSATPPRPGTSTPAAPTSPATPAGPGDRDGSREAGGDRASRGDSPARAETAGQEAASGQEASGQEASGGVGEAAVSPGTYTVRPGDNLWAIAEEQKLPGGWPALYETNRETVGADPDLILPGQSLDLDAQ